MIRMKNRNRARQSQSPSDRSGFTLMEVLLVLVILVVLASFAVNVFTGTQEKADQSAAAAQVGLYKRAVDMYKFHTKQFPGSLEDLVTKPGDATVADRWAGPYMDKIGLDPWDNEYRFAAPGKHNTEGFDVWSVGPDGQDGSADDIGNWDNKTS
jgi:general secretion pathway protein G